MKIPLKVSIVTVSFNAANTIEQTIQSVVNQDYPHVEYIIMDGNSKDDTVSIANRYADNITKIISAPDKGIYDAMNKGIALATGDVIGILNADDQFAHAQVISTIAKVLDNPTLSACYGDLIYFCNETPNKINRYWKGSPFKVGSFAKGWNPPHPTFFVKREIYEKYGCFDLSYTMGNDIELMMRFLEKYQITTAYIPQILVKMRLGGVSNRSIGNILKQNKMILHAAKKLNIPISPVTFGFYKIMNRLSQFIFKPGSDQFYAN